MGESPMEAAYNGRTEIGKAAITITLVDVVVFLPIAFLSGILGKYMQSSARSSWWQRCSRCWSRSR